VFYTATYTEPKDIELGLSLALQNSYQPMEAQALLEALTSVLYEHRDPHVSTMEHPLEEEMELLKQYMNTFP
jgi:hypothetical protein